MARPARTPSPRLAALLGEDTTNNLIAALGDAAARDLDSQLAELAQLGQLKGLRFQIQLWAASQRQTECQQADRDRLLLGRLTALDALDERVAELHRKVDALSTRLALRLDQIDALQQQYHDDAERVWLESHGAVVLVCSALERLRCQLRGRARPRLYRGRRPRTIPLPPVPVPLSPAPIVLVAREREQAA
jgi:hypothetical protein